MLHASKNPDSCRVWRAVVTLQDLTLLKGTIYWLTSENHEKWAALRAVAALCHLTLLADIFYFAYFQEP